MIFRRLPKSRSAADRPKADGSVPVERRAGIVGQRSGRGANKKERQTKAAPRTPTKGHTKQHKAGAPDGALRPSTAFVCSRAVALRLVVFEEAAT